MKYFIDVYGCQMNVVESQGLAGILQKAGWEVAQTKEECDLLVFYTCCIRESAEQKVYGNIGAAKLLKKANPNLIIALGGCMAQKKETAAKVQKSYSNVDILFGTAEPYKLLDFLEQFKATKKMVVQTQGKRNMEQSMPTLHDNPVVAKVNIMHGCDKFCTFCIVPFVRGREVSRNFDNIVKECEELLQRGYKDITLIGQNVNSYNFEGKTFAQLLKSIADLPYKFRLKFTSPHPQDMGADVIDVVATHENLGKVIHLPLQSGSDRILKLMNRTYSKQKFLDLVNDIRTANPKISLTTDIIVGFPTETEEDFLDTIDVMQKSKFNNVFGFVYSKRSGTPAAKMDGQIDQATKRDRITRLIKTQATIGQAHASSVVGDVFEVLCTGYDGEKALCRTECDRVVVLKKEEIQIGTLANVKITATKNSNLLGELIY